MDLSEAAKLKRGAPVWIRDIANEQAGWEDRWLPATVIEVSSGERVASLWVLLEDGTSLAALNINSERRSPNLQGTDKPRNRKPG